MSATVLLLLALSAPAPPAAPSPGAPFPPAYSSGCIASLREFAYELSSAVEVGDVNRLAALYRWRGTSTRAGYAIMERLKVLAGRPLLQIDPVYPVPPAAPAATGPPAPGMSFASTASPASDASDAPAAADAPAAVRPIAAFPQPSFPAFDPGATAPPRRGPPIGLRLEQTLVDGTTAAPTTLWLRRELGCWWVTL